MELRARIKERRKEGKTNQMITLNIRDKQRKAQSITLDVLHKFLSQTDNTTASIKNQHMLTCPHLNTRGIPAMPKSMWPRGRIASTHSPKANQKMPLICHISSLTPDYKLSLFSQR